MKTIKTATIIICAASFMSAKAVDATWQATTDVSWENPSNWSTGIVPGSTTNAIFGDPTGLLAPVLATTQQLSRVQFDASEWTISGTGMLRTESTAPFVSTAEGTNTVESDILLLANSTFTANEGNTLILTGDVKGDGSRKNLYVGGLGTVRFEGIVSNVKDFRIQSGGTIELAMPTRMGTDYEDRIEGGSTIRFYADEQCRIHWPRYSKDGILDLNGFTQTFQGLTLGHLYTDARATVKTGPTGKLKLTQGLSFQPYSWNDRNRTGTPVIQGNVELTTSGYNSMTVVEQDAMEVQIKVEAVISGVGGVRCRGDGTLQFTAANTYAGDTTVAQATLGSRTGAGRLIIDGGATETSSGTGMGTGPVTVEPTGLIGGSGAIGHVGRIGSTLSLAGELIPANIELGTEEVINLSTVAPGGVDVGTEIGTLNVNGDVSLGQYSRLAIDIGADNASDTLAIVGSLTVDATGTRLDLSIPETVALEGDYVLAEFNSISGEFTEVWLNGVLVGDATQSRSIGMTHHIDYTPTSILLKQSPPVGITVLLR